MDTLITLPVIAEAGVRIPYALEYDQHKYDEFIEAYPILTSRITELFYSPEDMSEDNLETLRFIHLEMAKGSDEAMNVMNAYMRVLRHKRLLESNYNG